MFIGEGWGECEEDMATVPPSCHQQQQKVHVQCSSHRRRYWEKEGSEKAWQAGGPLSMWVAKGGSIKE